MPVRTLIDIIGSYSLFPQPLRVSCDTLGLRERGQGGRCGDRARGRSNDVTEKMKYTENERYEK